jgi:sec-independent protein translocase protein TatC
MPNTAVEPETEKEKRELGSMSLLQHIEELRKRLIYCILAVAVCFGVGWYYSTPIYEKMQVPIKQALKAHNWDPQLAYLSPTDPFNNYLKIGLIVGLFIASPIIFYQVWMFISPGLYRHEKRFVLPFLFLAVGLFVGGGVFGFKIVFPVALDFLIYQGGNLKPVITITEYTNLFLTIILGLSLIFELPIVIGFAAMMGVVSAKFLFKHIRGAVFICFVIAAVLTPTTDVMNMTIYAAPMVLLYVGSIGIAWFVHPSQRRKRRERRERANN